jgi:uncharacterized protein
VPDPLLQNFIDLSWSSALQVVLLGFVGGVLSGFIGSGGAFFMTPGMMNLGVSGVVAVGSNITHKFGKAMMGSKKHGEMGNVDKRLGVFLIFSSFIGIRLAVWLNSLLVKSGGAGSHGEGGGSAASDLYISAVFIGILSLVAISMLRDVARGRDGTDDAGPSMKIADFVSRLKLPPYISFPVADVRVSLWVLIPVGLATGYLAGTIGVGGFVGVPAMIYILGVPTAVAAGTELYLAMYMGAFGAINYAYLGFVDIRLTVLLFLGSLVGVYMGAYGTKVVKEVVIRLVTGVLILLCVVSRAVAVPVYARQLGWTHTDPAWDAWFNLGSKGMLYCAGIVGTLIILVNVMRAYTARRRVYQTLLSARDALAPDLGAVSVQADIQPRSAV